MMYYYVPIAPDRLVVLLTGKDYYQALSQNQREIISYKCPISRAQ